MICTIGVMPYVKGTCYMQICLAKLKNMSMCLKIISRLEILLIWWEVKDRIIDMCMYRYWCRRMRWGWREIPVKNIESLHHFSHLAAPLKWAELGIITPENWVTVMEPKRSGCPWQVLKSNRPTHLTQGWHSRTTSSLLSNWPLIHGSSLQCSWHINLTSANTRSIY